jgi:hypothetical protein
LNFNITAGCSPKPGVASSAGAPKAHVEIQDLTPGCARGSRPSFGPDFDKMLKFKT